MTDRFDGERPGIAPFRRDAGDPVWLMKQSPGLHQADQSSTRTQVPTITVQSTRFHGTAT